MTDLTYVSLFSGIEAFSVAASRIEGVRWHPVFFSEIEPFPCAVLAHRFPNVPNLGDICKIRVDREKGTITNGDTTVPLPRTGIDILAGGSPCQDCSVAGKRAGMAEGSGTRSALAFEYSRLVEELRPRILLWENVPGVLSSNGGRDFLAFQRSLVERGYSLAYRVLDAQYARVDGFPLAVPQRRRRVWLVGCLGADESVPAQILFERPCVLGDTPPRRTQGQGSASPPGYRVAEHDCVVGGAGFGETGQGFWQSGIQTLRADHQGVNWPSNVAVTPCGTGAGGDCGGRGDDAGEGSGTGPYGDGAETLDASYFKGAGERNGKNRTVAVVPLSDCLTPGHPQTHRVYRADGAAYTLDAGERSGQDQRAILVESASFVSGDHKASCDGGDVSNTLPSTTGGFKPGAVAVATFENHGQDSRVKQIDVSDTRSRKDGTGGNNLPLVVSMPVAFAQNQREEVRDLGDASGTLPAEDGSHQRTIVAVPSVCKTLSAEGFDGMPDIQKGNGMPVVAVRTAQTGANGCGISAEVAHTLDLANGQAVAIGFKAGQSANSGLGDEREVSPTLSSQPSALEPTVAVGFSHSNSDISIESKPLAECAMTIRSAVTGEGSVVVGPALCLDAYNQSATEESCMTLRSAMTGTVGNDADPKVCIGVKYLASEKSREPTSVNVSQALGAGRNDQSVAYCGGSVPQYLVRRLTPIECERLMGFPDGWTKIPWRIWQESHRKGMSYESLLNEHGMKIREPTTEECPDSPRYKALGNSMCGNCMEWILRRIVAAFRLGMIEEEQL